jgi:hypothetical protein
MTCAGAFLTRTRNADLYHVDPAAQTHRPRSLESAIAPFVIRTSHSPVHVIYFITNRPGHPWCRHLRQRRFHLLALITVISRSHPIPAHLPALAELTGSEHGTPKFALRAVYSRSEASAESLAASAKETLGLSEGPAVYFDVKSDKSAAPETSALAALLGREDVQGVIVVLPITLQPDVIRQALAAGKSVLSEKPVGPDVAAGVKLIDEYRATYEKKGIIWVGGPLLYVKIDRLTE